MTKTDLPDGYTLETDKHGLRLLWRGEEIARPASEHYARLVIKQHRPAGRTTEETT